MAIERTPEVCNVLTIKLSWGSRKVKNLAANTYCIFRNVICKGFPGGASVKVPACQCRKHKRHEFDPWVRKITWKWQPTQVFLSGESHGQREPSELQSIGLQRVGHK